MTVSPKKPFGKAKFSPVKHARYLDWEDAFDVEFDDGLSFLEAHGTIKKANKISAVAVPKRVSVPKKFRTHFKIEYDTGEVVVCFLVIHPRIITERVYPPWRAEEFKEVIMPVRLGPFRNPVSTIRNRSSGSGRVDDIQSHPQGEIRGATKLVKITEDVHMYAAKSGNHRRRSRE